MRRAGDYPSTPNAYKKLADEIATNLGIARTSEIYTEDEELVFKNKFLTIETVTIASGYELLIVNEDGTTKRLFENAPPMSYDEFRMFLKGLAYGFRIKNQQSRKINAIAEKEGDVNAED